MKKHKICIIGDGLSGLITAQILGQLDLEIDLISKPNSKKNLDNRTTAISPSNYEFILKNLTTKKNNIFFGCKKISLFNEKEKNKFINFMNFENQNKNLIFITKNKTFKNILLSNIKSNKKIKILRYSVDKIDVDQTKVSFKNKKKNYDMILLCVGRKNYLVEKILGKRIIQENQNEVAFTCTVKHDMNLAVAKQYFLKEGPMALLPINNRSFSLIWSTSKKYASFQNKQIKDLVYSKLMKILSKKIKINLNQINSFPIYFKFNKNFYKKNIFAIGESVYNVHPIAGQGFNLVIRDLRELYEKIKTNISLGIQIKDSSILRDLYLNRKPENLLYGLGIDLTQQFFRYNKIIQPFKNTILKDIDKFSFLKKIGLKIADKGILN
tara:strand:+ start:530 stop:1675 length:1146 start_codon:yes stop_codon:yes gene_type:complete